MQAHQRRESSKKCTRHCAPKARTMHKSAPEILIQCACKDLFWTFEFFTIKEEVLDFSKKGLPGEMTQVSYALSPTPHFLAHNFFAILLVTLPSCPFAPFVTMPKAKSKSTAHAECAERAARIHKQSNQVSLEEELDQISAADAVGHSKMKKQSKARTAFNAQTMATKAKLKKTPGPDDSVKDKDSCLDGSIEKFLFHKDTAPTFSTPEASKLKKSTALVPLQTRRHLLLTPRQQTSLPLLPPPPPPPISTTA